MLCWRRSWVPAGAKLTNTAEVNLGSGFIDASSTTVKITGCTINGGSAGTYGAQVFFRNSASISDVTFDGNTWTSGGYANCLGAIGGGGHNASATLTSCTFLGSPSSAKTHIYLNSASITMSGCEIVNPTYVVINVQNSATSLTFSGYNKPGIIRSYGKGATITIVDGATVSFLGNSTKAAMFASAGEGTINFGSNVTVITSNGQSVILNGGVPGTCSVIKNDGAIS